MLQPLELHKPRSHPSSGCATRVVHKAVWGARCEALFHGCALAGLMKESGLLARPLAWLKERAPQVHRFLTRADKPYPLIREVGGIGAFLLLLAVILWGATGQTFLVDSPVVVVESGSMMHCAQGAGGAIIGRDCDRADDVPYGRFGTIDPGDLIFVKDADSRNDIRSWAGAVGRCDAFTDYLDCGCDGVDTYGACGDVIIFQKTTRSGPPIIHRAMAYLQVHGDGTFSIDLPAKWGCTDLDRVPRTGLEHTCLARMGFNDLHNHHALDGLTAAQSGFLTRGDNNAGGDQGLGSGTEAFPVTTANILGKARGELPWLGLVKLFVSDVTSGASNYRNASPDPKVLMGVSLAVIVLSPVAVENVVRFVQKRRGQDD